LLSLSTGGDTDAHWITNHRAQGCDLG
jgi:hypothetical protein